MTKEEAIKELRGFIGQLTEGCQEAIKVLIPELKESEDERIRKDIFKFIDEQYPEAWKAKKAKMLTWLEKQKEQKPTEWSEEDEKMLRTIISDGSRGVELDSNQISWLKSRRPQPKQEQKPEVKLKGWMARDRDEEHLKSIINTMERVKNDESAASVLGYYESDIAWLKSLRPQHHWKPSEEQMEALERASTNEYLSAKQFDILVSLYEQLKKLM